MSIARVLGQQAGVIGRAQALGQGMSSATISRRLARGLWVRVYPRVYFATDHALTAEARVRAAFLWAGPAATVNGTAAAWWLGLWTEPPGLVEITIPHRWRLPEQRGVRVRRCDLDPADRIYVNDVWVTAMPLTALEAAAALGGKGSQLLDRALQRHVTFPDLYAAYCRGLGRAGWAAVATLLRAAGDWVASAAERIMTGPMRDAGLTGWHCGYRVGGYELDFAVPTARVAIEIDGWAWHSDTERFRHDRRRQNALVLGGWVVLRFTWHDLTARPEAVIGEVRAALRAA